MLLIRISKYNTYLSMLVQKSRYTQNVDAAWVYLLKLIPHIPIYRINT